MKKNKELLKLQKEIQELKQKIDYLISLNNYSHKEYPYNPNEIYCNEYPPVPNENEYWEFDMIKSEMVVWDKEKLVESYIFKNTIGNTFFNINKEKNFDISFWISIKHKIEAMIEDLENLKS